MGSEMCIRDSVGSEMCIRDRNNEGKLFGVNQLVKAAQSYAPLKMEDMNNIIFSKLDDWRGDLSFVDDTAIFSCKFF